MSTANENGDAREIPDAEIRPSHLLKSEGLSKPVGHRIDRIPGGITCNIYRNNYLVFPTLG
jgi:hypothetical protein